VIHGSIHCVQDNNLLLAKYVSGHFYIHWYPDKYNIGLLEGLQSVQ
jgi:hypothetical protein